MASAILDHALPDVQSCSGQGASRHVPENLVPGIGHTTESLRYAA